MNVEGWNDGGKGVGVPGEGISLRGLDGWRVRGRLGESESYSESEMEGAEGVASKVMGW